ncbi:MAG: hypothetical protein R3E39_16045 [Anaerolineae bacterium]
MYSSMMLNQLVQSDYEKVRRQAIVRRVLSFVLRRPNQLISLNALLEHCDVVNQHSLGVQSVPIKQIIGTHSRGKEFDSVFLPNQTHTASRWTSVMKASYRGISLPPIVLVKVNEYYFVVDGHHRISVGRAVGQTYIDAEVTEMELREKSLRDVEVN